MYKLAIILTHPIQYYAPLFKLLTDRGNVDIKVFYTWERGSESFDKGFGKQVAWDIPLLEGYNYSFVSNNGNTKRGFFDLKNPSLHSEIKNWGAQAVLIFSWNYWSHLKAMWYFKGKIPVIFRGDSHLLDAKSLTKRFLRKIVLTTIYRYIDYALYVGTNNKNYYLAHGLKEKQLIFAPHAIDNERFFDNTEKQYGIKAQEWRKKLGYTEGDIVFIFVGKLEDKKNPLLLLTAFKALTQTNIRLLIVGNGVLELDLKTAAQEDTRIQFLDFQNQSMMPIIYRVADIYVLPSRGPEETWGLAVNESMACGRPVLVSDIVGCAVDLVKNDENGYIFKSDDKVDLMKRMNKFIEVDILLSKMGENAQNTIKNWSFEAIAESIEGF